MRHCSNTSWIALFRVLSPTSQSCLPANQVVASVYVVRFNSSRQTCFTSKWHMARGLRDSRVTLGADHLTFEGGRIWVIWVGKNFFPKLLGDRIFFPDLQSDCIAGIILQIYFLPSKSVWRIFSSEINHTPPQKSNARPLLKLEVSSHATWSNLICCKNGLNVGGGWWNAYNFPIRFAAMLQNRLHVFVIHFYRSFMFIFPRNCCKILRSVDLQTGYKRGLNIKHGLCIKAILHETIRNDDVWRNTALQHYLGWLQHCSNIATLRCAKNCRCESSCVSWP